MSDAFLERTFNPPLTPTDVLATAASSGGCLQAHKVVWNSSFLARDGHRMVCWLHAPDAESARIALRQAKADVSRLWSGTVHDAPDIGAIGATNANVLVERSFAIPVTFEDVAAIERKGQWCLDTHRVQAVRSFFALDRKRMICLYRAPDAESVRVSQREANMPFERVWAFQRVEPAPT